MGKLFIKQSDILSSDALEFLLDERARKDFTRSLVTSKEKISDRRTSTEINFNNYVLPDFCTSLIDLSLKFDLCEDWLNVMCRESLSLLRYDVGGRFVKHQDTIKSNHKRKRYYSSSTLIYESPDLEGGDLLLYDNTSVPHKIDLKVGETVLFHSRTWHEVTEVKQGQRIALIAWLSK